jgi:hypothetical protein
MILRASSTCRVRRDVAADDNGNLTRSFQHICWDGCMFSNETMMKPETWRSVLSTMIDVRNAHGWN